jgi:hypothetical protein
MMSSFPSWISRGAPEVVVFFKSYLVDQFTCYAWEDDLSPEFPSSLGVGQGSALSPILSALCLAPPSKNLSVGCVWES